MTGLEEISHADASPISGGIRSIKFGLLMTRASWRLQIADQPGSHCIFWERRPESLDQMEVDTISTRGGRHRHQSGGGGCSMYCRVINNYCYIAKGHNFDVRMINREKGSHIVAILLSNFVLTRCKLFCTKMFQQLTYFT